MIRPINKGNHVIEEAIEILQYAKKINPDGEYVFMPFGKPIITCTFDKRLARYCREAGVPYHSSHKIRFYTTSRAYNGENLVQISKMLGHSNVATTLNYLRDCNQDEDYSSLFEQLGTQKIG
ncbi:MAG: site-specific integrase [Lachnospiraceae bacterium]|nr:site-specific integrase [Lachnospiraceae bacterium]